MAKKPQLIFVATVIASLWVVACGRQVTPNPPGLGAGGAPPGYMAVFFSVAAPFNFSSYQYLVVLNTTGSGVTPSTDTVQTNWAGYSYAMVARGNGVSHLRGSRAVQAKLHQPAHSAGVADPGHEPADVFLQSQC